ncbi:MAG: hypothetical protein LBM71_04215 [Elusimicrobiota bacterium]|jgi:hypothetical protein|nr:hypothetical protein [Elusimicrobiota bacterium]
MKSSPKFKLKANILLKLSASALVVFLALPLIFETDTKINDTSAEAYSLDGAEQEEEGMLPILGALPAKSGKFVKNYTGRLKRFYVDSLLNPPSQDNDEMYGAEPQEDDSLLSFLFLKKNKDTRASFDNQEETYSADAVFNDFGASDYSESAVQQTIYGAAPVKGLFESSSLDPYETQMQDQTVSSSVINKVNRATRAARRGGLFSIGLSPDAALKGQDAKVGPSIVRQGVFSAPLLASARTSAANNTSANSGNKYIGIAPKQGGYGSYSGQVDGFRGSGMSAGFSDNVASQGDFTQVANRTMARIRAISSQNTANGGQSNVNGANPSSGTTFGRTNQRPRPDLNINFGNQSKNNQNGQTHKDLFDPKAWPVKEILERKSTCEDPETIKEKTLLPPDSQFKLEDPDQTNSSVQSNAEVHKVDTCTTIEPGKEVNQDIVKQNAFLLDAGLDGESGGHMIPAEESSSAIGLELALGLYGANKKIITEGKPSSIKAFNIMDPNTFNKTASQGNTVVLTVSEQVAKAYPDNAILIQPGAIETKEGAEIIAKQINQFFKDEEARAARAKEREKEFSKQKAEELKKEMASDTASFK